MKKSVNCRILILLVALVSLPYGAWYLGNYYAAGLVQQEMLIEFSMHEDFDYCHKWQTHELDSNYKIELFQYIPLTGNRRIEHNLLSFPYSSVKVIHMMGKLGIDPNAVIKTQYIIDSSGLVQRAEWPAIFYSDNPDRLNALIDLGADIHFQDENDWNVMIASAELGQIEKLNFFVKKGLPLIDPEKGENNYDVMHAAIYADHLEVIQFLIDEGVDVNGKNDSDWPGPYLYFAVGLPKIMALLIKHGADLNIGDPGTATSVLHKACMSELEESVMLLLNAGADPGLLDNKDKTPIDYLPKESPIRKLFKARGIRKE